MAYGLSFDRSQPRMQFRPSRSSEAVSKLMYALAGHSSEPRGPLSEEVRDA